MINTELAISILAVLISGIALILNTHKSTRKDAADVSATSARQETKLDMIATGIDDIRVDLRTMRTKIDGLTERLATVEANCKNALHRIDAIEQVVQHWKPPDN